ncbi:MAG: EAL domain-containing protein [Sphaerotilus natans]
MTDAVTLRSAEAMVHTPVMVTLYSVRGRALYRNPAARSTVDHPDAGARSRVLDRRELRQIVEQLHRSGQARATTQVSTSLGPRWHDISVRLCRDPVEGRQVFLVSEIDITELKQAEARAHWLAMRDTLTGLPNRSFVSRDFQQRLDGLHASGGEAALIFIDLDRFKAVNDSLGHDIGDRLLVEIAQRLYATLETDDLVARLGGDEFLVLVSNRDGDIERRTRQLVRRLQAELGRTVMIGRLQMQVTPSMGICRFPRDGHDIDALLRNADLALYRAKEAGGNGVGWFTPELVRLARERIQLEQDLRVAVERHQFEVHYQPRVQVGSGRLVGAEALVRWRHPRRGLVAPDVFIGLSEETGLIRSIGAMVLEKAARQQVLWQSLGRRLRISVNLSPRQFGDPGLVDTIARIVRDTGCDPQQIELEITESVMLGQDESTNRALHQLADMGFRLAIDDFGTGYSNLAYLQRCPISTLKIDRSFIAGERRGQSAGAAGDHDVPDAGHRDGGRGRRDRGAARLAAHPGLRRVPGPPVQPGAAGRPVRAKDADDGRSGLSRAGPADQPISRPAPRRSPRRSARRCRSSGPPRTSGPSAPGRRRAARAARRPAPRSGRCS